MLMFYFSLQFTEEIWISFWRQIRGGQNPPTARKSQIPLTFQANVCHQKRQEKASKCSRGETFHWILPFTSQWQSYCHSLCSGMNIFNCLLICSFVFMKTFVLSIHHLLYFCSSFTDSTLCVIPKSKILVRKHFNTMIRLLTLQVTLFPNMLFIRILFFQLHFDGAFW